MSTFVKLIPMELDLITQDAFIEPTEPVTKKDHVVGNMDDELKRLWTLYIQYQKKAEIAEVEARYGGNIAEAQSLAMRTHALDSIFWIAVNDKHQTWDKPSMGVRSGWKVVWHELDTPTFGTMFMMGGGP